MHGITVLPIILGVSGSIYKTTKHALGQLGIEHGPANKLMRKLHEHAIVTLGKIVRSRRALEGKTNKGHKRNRDPH